MNDTSNPQAPVEQARKNYRDVTAQRGVPGLDASVPEAVRAELTSRIRQSCYPFLRTPLSRLKQGLEEARVEATSVQDYEQAVDQALVDADIALSTFGAL